jgi:exonuclease III
MLLLEGTQRDTYRMTQHSSSGNRAESVTVFTRKYLEVIPGSVYGSPSGPFTIGCYHFYVSRVIISGIYGVSAGSDAASMEVVEEFHNKLTETTTLHRNRTIAVKGDFNIKLDVINSVPDPNPVGSALNLGLDSDLYSESRSGSRCLKIGLKSQNLP